MNDAKLQKKSQQQPDRERDLYKELDRKWANSRPDHAIMLVSTPDSVTKKHNPDDPLLWLLKKIPSGEVLLCDSLPGPDIELHLWPNRTLVDWVAKWVIRNSGKVEDYPEIQETDINPGIRKDVWQLVQQHHAQEQKPKNPEIN